MSLYDKTKYSFLFFFRSKYFVLPGITALAMPSRMKGRQTPDKGRADPAPTVVIER